MNEAAPYFFIPCYIELVGSLPDTLTNKVKKFELRDCRVTADMRDRMAEGFVVERAG